MNAIYQQWSAIKEHYIYFKLLYNTIIHNLQNFVMYSISFSSYFFALLRDVEVIRHRRQS